VKRAERRPEGLLRIEPTRTHEQDELYWSGYSQEEHQLLCAPARWHDYAGGTITATRDALDNWMRQLPRPWMTGVEGHVVYRMDS
jgi:hypothetical protein